MNNLFYQAYSSASTEFPYWYTRKFAECDGNVPEVRCAKALACAYAHSTPSIYPLDLLPGGKTSFLRGVFPMPWLTNSFDLAKEDELKQAGTGAIPLYFTPFDAFKGLCRKSKGFVMIDTETCALKPFIKHAPEGV